MISTASSVASTRDKIIAISDDFDQIEKDVARCTWHLLTGTQRSVSMQMVHKRHRKVRKLIRRKQRRLANLINLTLKQSYPFLQGTHKLRYYQGYHDVACIVLSTLGGSRPVSVRSLSSPPPSDMESMAASMGLDLPAAVLLQLSQSHLADCMRANFLPLQTTLRLTLMPLLAVVDPAVHAHLFECEMEPFFALSWIITWFSHDIRDTELVKRLFDAFLVSSPLLPIYMSVAMMAHSVNRQEILRTECEFALLHQTLQGLPRNSSMVGWKYRPGDGYVSDDEEDDDDDESVGSRDILEESDLQSVITSEGGGDNHDDEDNTANPPGVAAVSIESGQLLAADTRVPFQDLIDTSIQFMERVPPHKMVKLASRYYGNEYVKRLLQKTPDVLGLMMAPPDWTVACCAPADWVLQQQARRTRKELRSGKKRNRSSTLPDVTDDEDEDEDHKPVVDDVKRVIDDANEQFSKQYLLEHARTKAVIAAGFGSPEDPERRKRRRRRMMLAGVTIAVAVLAVFVGRQQQRGAVLESYVGKRQGPPTSRGPVAVCR